MANVDTTIDNTWVLTPFMSQIRYIIDDRGGVDWFDFSSWSGNYAYNLYIDLTPGVVYKPSANWGYILEFRSWSWIENAYGGAGHDTIVGNNAGNWLLGQAGNDWIGARGGNDFVVGGFGSDTIHGEAGHDRIFGDNENGSASRFANDLIYGGSGNDIVAGQAGSDTIHGGDGDDVISGGVGQDHLVGGAGFDRFVFNEVLTLPPDTGHFGQTWVNTGESAFGAADIIYGFDNPGILAGDVIDLRSIDAMYGSLDFQDQRFVFNGTGTGALRLYDAANGDTLVHGWTSMINSTSPSLQIVIKDGWGVTAAHYTAHDFLL